MRRTVNLPNGRVLIVENDMGMQNLTDQQIIERYAFLSGLREGVGLGFKADNSVSGIDDILDILQGKKRSSGPFTYSYNPRRTSADYTMQDIPLMSALCQNNAAQRSEHAAQGKSQSFFLQRDDGKVYAYEYDPDKGQLKMTRNLALWAARSESALQMLESAIESGTSSLYLDLPAFRTQLSFPNVKELVYFDG